MFVIVDDLIQFKSVERNKFLRRKKLEIGMSVKQAKLQ